jgi:hypothetical protein
MNDSMKMKAIIEETTAKIQAAFPSPAAKPMAHWRTLRPWPRTKVRAPPSNNGWQATPSS